MQKKGITAVLKALLSVSRSLSAASNRCMPKHNRATLAPPWVELLLLGCGWNECLQSFCRRITSMCWSFWRSWFAPGQKEVKNYLGQNERLKRHKYVMGIMKWTLVRQGNSTLRQNKWLMRIRSEYISGVNTRVKQWPFGVVVVEAGRRYWERARHGKNGWCEG